MSKTLPPTPRPDDPTRNACCSSCGCWFRGRRGLSAHIAQVVWCRLAVAA